MKKRKTFVADFETTTDPADLRVWAAGLVNVNTLETELITNNIDDFFSFLSNQNSIVYFHNLKFDGEFILAWLLKHGFKYSDVPENKTFSTLITDAGMFYKITVIFEKLNKKYKKIEIYDSLKKLPFKVSEIAKAFKLEDKKGEIDYNAFRPVNHILTDEEKDYLIKDCRIVAAALKIQFEQDLKKMTVASDALSSYKEIIGKQNFESWFPVFPFEMDADIRLCYKGGWTYLNPLFKDIRINEGKIYDVNSLYPWALYNCPLPYSYPVFFEGLYQTDDRYPLFIQHFRCCFEIKPDHLPCVQMKNSSRFVPTEYLTSSIDEMGIDEPVELHLTSVDFYLFLENYDVWDVTFINGWKFKASTEMFKPYIDKWMKVKETETGALRQLAKLMLNSLYGKFATNPKSINKIPVLVNNTIHYIDIDTEAKAKEFNVKPPELRDPVYTALACFVTAYAREKTITTAQSMFNRFIYADTDSLHIIGYEEPDIDIHPTKLGCWKHEGDFTDSYYIRAKTYVEKIKFSIDDNLHNYAAYLSNNYERLLNGNFEIYREENIINIHDLKVTCAGMPDNVKENVTFDNFVAGSVFFGKMVPRRYENGVILEETNFTIK